MPRLGHEPRCTAGCVVACHEQTKRVAPLKYTTPPGQVPMPVVATYQCSGNGVHIRLSRCSGDRLAAVWLCLLMRSVEHGCPTCQPASHSLQGHRLMAGWWWVGWEVSSSR